MTPPRGRAASIAPTVAVVEKRGRFLIANPVFERGRGVSLDSAKGAGVGDLVLLGSGKRGVRVVRRIGRPDVAGHVLEGLMLEHGLRRSFPRAVEDGAESMSQSPGAHDAPRLDLTGLATFTIDPATARDYDDAISAVREDSGTIRVWIHIADVSAYVRPGSALEKEAFRRATSVYVPGAVEPMLPHALSSGACSLVTGQDRLAVTVELEMDTQTSGTGGAEVRSAAFHRSRIRSDARLTYPQVDRIFGGQLRAEDPWGEPLALAREVSAALRAKRESRGSLAIESSEPVFEFDAHGHVVGVEQEQQTESHKLIEELMILANEQVAGHLADRRVPTLYRVHEKPDPSAVERLAAQLESLEVPTPPLPKSMSPQQAGDAASEISHAIARYVKSSGRGKRSFGTLVLRAMKQAYYSPKNIGHAGLASPRYSHFTSPIRRYPDLVAHRALLASIGADDVAPRADELFDAAEHSSEAERAAMKIERSADDICLCFLLERRLAEAGWELELDGEVVGLISKGLFVEFGEEGFEGFLPIRRMRGDWWDINEEETALVGADSGRKIRIGDPLRVAVGRVDAPRGRADLELAAD